MIRIVGPLIVLGPKECERLNRGDRIEVGTLQLELAKPDLLRPPARRARPPDPPEAREFLPRRRREQR